MMKRLSVLSLFSGWLARWRGFRGFRSPHAPAAPHGAALSEWPQALPPGFPMLSDHLAHPAQAGLLLYLLLQQQERPPRH